MITELYAIDSYDNIVYPMNNQTNKTFSSEWNNYVWKLELIFILELNIYKNHLFLILPCEQSIILFFLARGWGKEKTK